MTTQHNPDLFYTTYYITNTLSLLGQLFIIITYISIRKKSNSFYGYVAWHSVIELPWLITNYLIVLFYTPDTTATTRIEACGFVAFLNLYSYIASMIWSSLIAWVIYSSLKKTQKLYKVKWYHPFLVCALSLILPLYSYFHGGFGPYKGKEINYCWFKDTHSQITYWIPFVITTVLNLFWYAKSVYHVKRNASQDTAKGFWILLYFPFIQILCNSGTIISKIASFLEIYSYLVLAVLPIILAKGQGLLEAFAYGANRSILTEIAKVWCKRRQRSDQKKPVSGFNEASLEYEKLQRTHLLL